MQLTNEQTEALKQRLEGRTIKCPICGNTDHILGSKLIALQLVEPNTDKNDGELPVISLSCKECGYIMPFRII